MADSGFEVEEKLTAQKEYFMAMAGALQAGADALRELVFNPTPKQVEALKNLLKDKLKELERWS